MTYKILLTLALIAPTAVSAQTTVVGVGESDYFCQQGAIPEASEQAELDAQTQCQSQVRQISQHVTSSTAARSCWINPTNPNPRTVATATYECINPAQCFSDCMGGTFNNNALFAQCHSQCGLW